MFCVGEDFKCCGSYIFACEGDEDYEVDGGEFCVCGKFLPVYGILVLYTVNLSSQKDSDIHVLGGVASVFLS